MKNIVSLHDIDQTAPNEKFLRKLHKHQLFIFIQISFFLTKQL